MNIAILIPELVGGGAERVATIIGDYFVEQSDNVFYFIGSNRGRRVYSVKGKIVQTGIKPISIGGKIKIGNMLYAINTMRKYKKLYNINVSISFMEEFNYINVLSRVKDKVYVRVCTILSKRQEFSNLPMYNKNVVKFLYNKADKVIVMTNYAKEEMIQKYGIQAKKVVKIPNPIAGKYISKQQGHWQYGDKVVVCVGRLESVKQWHIAIRAFSRVIQQEKDAKLIILGQGTNRKRLQNLIKQLNLEHSIFILGFQKDIMHYLSHSKVFLMTSKVEGFPNSMIEAMSIGLPVISIDSYGAPAEILGSCNGVKEITYAEYGVLIPYINHEFADKEPLTNEEKLLSEAIIQMLSDKQLYNKYVNASKKRAKYYELNRVMRLWSNILRSRNSYAHCICNRRFRTQ